MYYATAKEMEKLDTLAVANGLQVRQMMELAGWHMVSLFKKICVLKKSKVVVVVGKGNKGGDGLTAARHLTNNGWNASVILLSKNISKDAKHHLNLIRKMSVPVVLYGKNKSEARRQIAGADVVIDALIGYHLNGCPRGEFKEVIEIINGAKKRTVAYDLPSGIDASSGECFNPCVRADVTLSLALPKRAFKKETAKKFLGRVFIADIGIPEFLYNRISRGSRPTNFDF